MWRADIEVPNLPVDMSSWGRSACYPRSTFYPLSDGPSIRNHRITISQFPAWSTCWSHSQAPLCYCALRMITKHAEGTFESLRYSFGGDHPSQTTHHTLSPCKGIRHQINKGWYFTNDSTRPGGQGFIVSHLSYTSFTQYQCEAVVKVHGVFPSRCGYAASSPRLQFHRAHGRDSAQIVAPFVQVGTYPTRNFATLGPL